MTEARIAGVVEGAAGEVVGGWAQLAKRPRRSAGGEVRVRTADGHVVEVAIAEATIDPVERREAAWAELEAHPGARWCADDAPAPDAEVELRAALVRGGDRIAAWGRVADTALAQRDGEAFRGGAEPVVRRLVASAVAIGDDAEARLDAVKATHAKREAKPRKAERRAAAAKPAVRLGHGIRDHLAVSWGVRCVGIGAAFVGLWCALAPAYWRSPALVAMSVLLAWPVVLDAMQLPPVRALPRAPAKPWTEIVGVGFLVVGGIALLCAFGSGDLRRDAPDRAHTAHVVAFVLAGVAFLVAASCLVITGGRRRLLRRCADAPAHASPIVDGAWGATDGRFVVGKGAPKVGDTSVAIASGEKLHWWGAATRDRTTGISSQNVSTTALEGFAPRVELHTADGAVVPVELAGARWWSTARLRSETGADKVEAADVVELGAPVRVVGRARDGVLRVGGDESLLVFASTDDVPRGLARARRRDRVALGLAALGVIGWAAALALAIRG